MSVEPIPTETKVLIIGGGPGGSYAGSVLAREGVDCVVLEADIFPRYHIGESMLASMRHYLRFIDVDSTFDQHGFYKKVGAAFKLNPENKEGYTDFIAANGPNGYAWNVIRSESDDLLFKHARAQGAKTYDGVKVTDIQFDTYPTEGVVKTEDGFSYIGNPVSVSWTRKADGSSGTIKVDYIIDASGRNGVVNTKYIKNRRYNTGLKNAATWGYWKNTSSYGAGTARANSPFFEALHDESGWAWFIPLKEDMTSIGIVMNQEMQVRRKKESNYANSKEFYLDALNLAPNLKELLGEGELTSEIKNASDFSYSSSSYASPRVRIVGDAGCFIDPFFSSGVHLAMTSALSAAATICAAMKGQVDEVTAGKWHSEKVSSGYHRFLLIVLSAYKQMRNQARAVLADIDEDNFDKAFAFFRPIIQGTADISDKLTQAEIDKTIDFCSSTFVPTSAADRRVVLDKMAANAAARKAGQADVEEKFSEEEQRVVNLIRARQMVRPDDTMNIDSFTTDALRGFAPVISRGRLGLRPAKGIDYSTLGSEEGIYIDESNGRPEMASEVLPDVEPTMA